MQISSLLQFFKIPERAVEFLYNFKTNPQVEYLQHLDENGIVVHPYKVLIIIHDSYTLRKP